MTTTTFGPDREYQAFLAQKRFMIQRARATGAHFYYPRIAEPRSGALEWEWVEASGLGTVYSTTVVRSKSGNHNVALIDLAEGPRMMSRVVGLSPESVVIGMQVRARIDVLDDMLARKSGAIVNISSGAAIGPGRGPYQNAPLRGGTLYGAEKAALERFTQGLAAEVYGDGIRVTCLSPSQVVATPGVMFHRLIDRPDSPRAEPVELMARAALLLATEPLEKVSGRVTYSQQILAEFGWIEKGRGIGIDVPGMRAVLCRKLARCCRAHR